MSMDKSKLLEALFESEDARISSNKTNLEPNQITEKIIGCAYKVGNDLGCGFLEKVYENTLAHELRKIRLNIKQQEEINVHYDGIVVGKYEADLLVEDCILIEPESRQRVK